MKIAILGTENSHAIEFARLLKRLEKYSDIELVGIYGYDEAANQKIVDEGHCTYIAKSADEFLGKVDAIMVTARHGDLHHEYAMPYVKAGIPCFIDKPFCVSLEKAQELANTAKENGALLCGGSCVKHLEELLPLKRYFRDRTVTSGSIAAPIEMDNEYGGFYFYSQHLIEMLITVFGRNVKSVTAVCHDIKKDKVSVIFNFGEFDVAGLYSKSGSYSVTLSATDYTSAQADCAAVGYTFEHEIDEFVHMVKTGKMPESYDELVYPIKLMHAIEKSYTEKKEIEIA